MKNTLQETEIYSNIINNSATPTFAVDKNHNIIVWNKACEKLTGKKASEMIGTSKQWVPFYNKKRVTLADLVIDNNSESVTDYYKNFSHKTMVKGGMHAEGWYPNLGGSAKYIFFHAAPIKNNKGEVVAAVETLEDITERRICDEKNVESLKKRISEMVKISKMIEIERKKMAKLKKELEELKKKKMSYGK